MLGEFDIKDIIDIGSQNARVSKFIYSAAQEHHLAYNILNGFKQKYYSQHDADDEETSTTGPSQELLSKLESPGEMYLTHKTFTVTPTGIFLRKGEEIGMFEMGSTIVMLFECPINSEVLVKEGDKVRMG